MSSIINSNKTGLKSIPEFIGKCLWKEPLNIKISHQRLCKSCCTVLIYMKRERVKIIELIFSQAN